MRTPSVSGETLTPFLKNSDRGRVRAVFMLKCEAEAEAICKRSSELLLQIASATANLIVEKIGVMTQNDLQISAASPSVEGGFKERF